MGQNNWKTYLALLIPVFVVFSPAMELGWIWDDDQYVYQNPTLHSAEGLRAIWLEPGATPQYYPLVFTALWSLYQAFGADPLPYHALNVVLHAVNVVLCFRILQQLRVTHAFWIALAFGLHPIQVESVAWVTELKNVLSGTMAGLAWLMLFPLLEDQDAANDKGDAMPSALSGKQRAIRWLLGIACFVGALFSKSVTASIPAAILVAVWYRSGRISKRQWLTALPLLLVGALFGGNTARLEVEFVGAQGDEFQHGLIERVGIAARCVVHYAVNAIAPTEQIFFYPRYQPTDWQAASLAVVGCVVFLALGIVLAWRGQRGLLAAFLFFAGSAFPALGFLNVYPHRYSFVADHFVYLPIIGLLAIIVTAIIESGKLVQQRFISQSTTMIRYSLVGVWLIFLAMGTIRHLPHFADEIALWEDTLSKNPTSAIAMHNLAMRYNESGRSAEALPLIEQAIELGMDRFQMLNTLGVVQSALGNSQAAAEAFRRSLEIFPDNALATHNLAKVLQGNASYEQLSPEARETLQLANELYIQSYSVERKFDHAFGAAVTSIDLQRPDTALHWLEVADRMRPNDLAIQLELAKAFMLKQDFKEARKLALQVLEIIPSSEIAQGIVKEAEERLAP